MNFHEVRFPTSLSFGSVGGPERRTEIVTLNNGYEERNTPWSQSRRKYDAGMGMRSLDDLSQVIEFFEARAGSLYGFRWKDWSDFKSCLPSKDVSELDQEIGIGDDTTSVFQLVKNYRSGDAIYRRTITKPITDTVKIAIDGDLVFEGQHYSVDFENGQVSFVSPPSEGAEISAGYEFDVPVRFATDEISCSVGAFSAGEIPSIPVIEVRI